MPKIVDRSISQAELDARGFERRLTQERVTPLAAGRRLPMVEVDGTTRILIAYYFM